MSILESLSPDDKRKLDNFMQEAKQELQAVQDKQESLRDLAKKLAEDFGVKPKHLLNAAKTAFRNNLAQKKEDMDTEEDILNVTGHG